MLRIDDLNDNDVLTVTAAGKLTKEDYTRIIPELEAMLGGRDRLRFLIRLEDFTGFEIAAAWEDLKFDTRHMHKFGKTAVIGDRKWEEWGTKISALFFSPEVRFFYKGQEDEAEAWVNG